MTTSSTSRSWRWAFIIAEATLASSFVIGVFIAPHFGWRGPFDSAALTKAHAVVVVLAWLFLLFASPFFLRLLGGVAITGLCMALCALVYVLVMYA